MAGFFTRDGDAAANRTLDGAMNGGNRRMIRASAARLQRKTMNQGSTTTSLPAHVPLARPVHVTAIPIGLNAGDPVGGTAIVRHRTDGFAIASAVCGLTAIIPVVSQVIGLGLGVASFVRLRRARRAGVKLGGRGWAITGIVSSGVALLGWIAVFVAFAAIGSSFSGSAETLSALAGRHP